MANMLRRKCHRSGQIFGGDTLELDLATRTLASIPGPSSEAESPF